MTFLVGYNIKDLGPSRPRERGPPEPGLARARRAPAHILCFTVTDQSITSGTECAQNTLKAIATEQLNVYSVKMAELLFSDNEL